MPDFFSKRDLSGLPRRARVAFAAHCVRRVAPIVCAWGPDEVDGAAVERLVAATEAYAAGRSITLNASRFDDAIMVVERRGEFENDSEIYPPYHAAKAVVAAFRGARDASENRDDASTLQAINEATFSVRSFTERKIQYPAEPEFRSELLRIHAAARREHWSDETAIDPSFFSDEIPVAHQVSIAVNDMCVELCRIIARDPRALKFIEWRQLEELVATALHGLCVDVELTPAAKDGGKDLVVRVTTEGKRHHYYIEIKHWRSGKKVGKADVTHFVQVNLRDKTTGGLFLSTSGFAKVIVSHLAQISCARVRLGGSERVVAICQRFVRAGGEKVWQGVHVIPELFTSHRHAHEYTHD